MWQTALEWLGKIAGPKTSPTVYLCGRSLQNRTQQNRTQQNQTQQNRTQQNQTQQNRTQQNRTQRARSQRTGGVVIEISLGAHALSGAWADARLSTGPSPARLRQVVQFCARRHLPVDVWLITGLWRMPARAEHIARWVHGLANDAGEAAIWIDTGSLRAGVHMPESFERRLEGHLRRAGCSVCRTRLFSESMPL